MDSEVYAKLRPTRQTSRAPSLPTPQRRGYQVLSVLANEIARIDIPSGQGRRFTIDMFLGDLLTGSGEVSFENDAELDGTAALCHADVMNGYSRVARGITGI